MATKQHSTLSGSDLHQNKIDGTTGTELTTPSETIYDARWAKRSESVSTTGTSTVTNTTTETAFSQSYTIPANTLTVGKTVRLTARGVYSTNTSAQTFTLNAKLGSTLIASTGANNLSASMSNRGWAVILDITCLSTGVSGTIEAQGQMYTSSSAIGTQLADMENTAPITIDTTSSQVLQLFVVWNAASAANTITCRQHIGQIIG